MKTDLNHLPETKQAELKAIKDALIPKYPEIEMIILFGSFARGTWVEDKYVENGYTYEYRSDYDLLIVTNNSDKANTDTFLFSILDQLDDLNFETAIHLEVESIDFVNRSLQEGKSFFSDVKKDGIFLFNTSRFQLADKRELSPKEIQAIAQSDFEEWFTSANLFYRHFTIALKDGENDPASLKIAAFQLHQATERYYSTIQLVFAGYKPKTHDLEVLGRRAKSLHMEFGKVFPKASTVERQRFMLLRKAYVDARYKPNYKITKADLDYLAERVSLLRKLTAQLCKEKIESFTK
jgi:predicted nucleotidyltransferase/HEPN domain-containing protein